MADVTMVTVVPRAGTAEIGLWCDVCSLPSLARIPLSALLPTGVLSLGDIYWCPGHQSTADLYRQWCDRRTAGPEIEDE